MLRLVVVTKDADSWGRQKFKFSALDINLVILDVGDYQRGDSIDVQKLHADLRRNDFDFILCDIPSIYQHLPVYHTILVGGRLPSWGLTNCIAAMRNSSLGNVIFYLWVKSATPISDIVSDFLDMWGYPYTLPLVEGKKKEESDDKQPMSSKFIVNIICSKEGFRAAKNPIFYVLLPTEDAAHALCNFLQRILYDYAPPECLLKDADARNGEERSK